MLPDIKTNLPKLTKQSSTLLNNLTDSLGLPREILASDVDINQVLTSLPNLLISLPEEKRNEGIARLCVACSVGLFDSAINYIWNETIRVLRNKLRNFGLSVIAQILENDFSDKELNSMMDSQLLNICLELNLISEEGFYFLDQCRDIRNNFSVAHPSSLGKIPPFEFLNFFDRCIKYAYDENLNRKGININTLLQSLARDSFDQELCHYWASAINDTYNRQQSRIIEILHGLYCDNKKSSIERNNCLTLSKSIIEYIPNDGKSRIVENHSKYLMESASEKVKASRYFFEKVNLVNLLPDSEKHGMIVSICKSLYDVHLAMNNFYNEPPFAMRLQEIESITRPEVSQQIFVEVVTLCAIGNGYGISFAAAPYYEKAIKTFSPREITIFFDLVNTPRNRVYMRVKHNSKCRERFKHLVSLINASSIPSNYQNDYQSWM